MAVVDADAPVPRERASTSAIAAAVGRKLALWMGVTLVSALGGGGAVLALSDRPPTPAPRVEASAPVVCECGAPTLDEIAECRLAADYARQAAAAVGVSEHVLEEVARGVLSSPPAP